MLQIEPASGFQLGTIGGKSMFARVSTYKTGPETTSDAPTEDIIKRTLEIPGCRGIYYLNAKETDKALSITLWDTEEALTASQQAANKLRTETSDAQKTQILEVEEFEVTASNLKD
jgi:heme-degrading monooxygenase HmoA